MRRSLHLSLVGALGVLVLCCGSHPTAPSEPGLSVLVAGTRFTVEKVGFNRDFMPIVAKPGPDGGAPLAGWVAVRIKAGARANHFTVSGAVFDQSGRRYATVASAVHGDSGASWDGSVASGAERMLEIILRDGPYLPVRSRAYAHVEFTDPRGNRGILRTSEAAVTATY